MKHVFVALAAVGLLVSGCGPAAEAEEVATENGSVEQQLTPCLSECYSYCSANSPTAADNMICRADCRDYVCVGE